MLNKTVCYIRLALFSICYTTLIGFSDIATCTQEDNISIYVHSQEQAERESPNFIAMTGDLILARPILLAATVIGAVLFVVSSPFSLLAGNWEQAADVLVLEPAKATFVRCLGCSVPEREL